MFWEKYFKLGGRFIIRRSDNGQYYFVLRAVNGKVIATSEQYESKQAAKKGIASIKSVSVFARILEEF